MLLERAGGHVIAKKDTGCLSLTAGQVGWMLESDVLPALLLLKPDATWWPHILVLLISLQWPLIDHHLRRCLLVKRWWRLPELLLLIRCLPRVRLFHNWVDNSRPVLIDSRHGSARDRHQLLIGVDLQFRLADSVIHLLLLLLVWHRTVDSLRTLLHLLHLLNLLLRWLIALRVGWISVRLRSGEWRVRGLWLLECLLLVHLLLSLLLLEIAVLGGLHVGAKISLLVVQGHFVSSGLRLPGISLESLILSFSLHVNLQPFGYAEFLTILYFLFQL